MKIIPDPVSFDRDVLVVLQASLKTANINTEIETTPYGKYTEYRMKGWSNGVCLHPIAQSANAIRLIKYYFDSKSQQWPSLKKPRGLQADINQAISTPGIEIPRVQKAIKRITDWVSGPFS